MNNYYISVNEFRKNPKAYSSSEITHMCGHQKLSKKFMRDVKDYLDWEMISFYQTLDEDFIEQMKEYVNWGKIFTFQRISESFIERHKEEKGFSWKAICTNYKIYFSKEFVLKYYNNMNMIAIIQHARLDEQIWRIILNDDKYDSDRFAIETHIPKVSIDFLREFKDKLDLNYRISYMYNDNPKFFEEFGNQLNTRGFGHYSESWHAHSMKIIRRYSNYINWYLINPNREAYAHTKEETEQLIYWKDFYMEKYK